MFVPSIPCGQTPAFPPNSTIPWAGQGLGCDCGCGMGCGMGLFDSGLDFSQWGVAEWATILGGLYVAFSVFSTTKRAARSVHRKTRAALKA